MPGETVLIIDDSEELRATIEAVLRFGGYRPFSASNGQDGFDLVARVEPDVILIDLELPDTTGLKVLKRLNEEGFKVPTIMMTGYGSEGTAAQALRLGVRDYLVKPFTTDEVLSSIERALHEVRLRSERDRLAGLLQRYQLGRDLSDKVGKSIIIGQSEAHLLQQIIEASTEVTGAEVGYLMLLDESQEQLRLAAACGEPPGVSQYLPARSGDQRLRPVLQDGLAVRLHSAEGCNLELQTGCVAQAVLQVPLQGRSRIQGLVTVDRRAKHEPFDEHDQQMLQLLAQYVVIVLEKTDGLDSGD
jgi:two-component system NtrC family sensor kinase